MADAAFGFRPVRTAGGPWTGQALSAVIPATDGTATFIGDFVKLAGSADATEKMPTIAQVAAGDRIWGCVVGFEPNYTDLTQKYRTASTKIIARVVPALPGTVFEGQADGAAAAGTIGSNVDVVVGAGNTTTGRSGMEIDISTSTTGTAQLQIVGPVQTEGEDLDTSAAGSNLLVIVNESDFIVATGV